MKLDDKLPNYASGPRERIVRTLRRTILALERLHVQSIECDWVALRTQMKLQSGKGTLAERYGFLQFLLDLTRKELGHAYNAESEHTRSIQGDLFTGYLQTYYPIPHKRDEKPIYRKLEALSDEQVRWNAQQHRKVGNAHLEHADALDAYADRRSGHGDAA